MKLDCVHVDTCLPDYWSGHHLPHVQIAVWPGMTLAEIKRSIRSELSQGAVAGSSENARLLSADRVDPGEEKQAGRVTRAAYAAVNRIKPAKKGQRRFFTDIEETEEYGADTVYAFFVFIDWSVRT